jgi:hypothetical protein
MHDRFARRKRTAIISIITADRNKNAGRSIRGDRKTEA